MSAVKKSSIIVGLSLILIILFAATAFASNYEITYVYYEDENGDIVKVDYALAVKQATKDWPRDRTLYDAAVAGITDALANYRSIWIVVDIGEEDPVVVYYSDAVDDGKTLLEAVEDNQYHLDDEPVADLVLGVDNGEAAPKPAVKQEWLDRITIVWSSITNRWVVDIYLDNDGLMGIQDYPRGWSKVDHALIKGTFVSQKGKTRSADLSGVKPEIDENNDLRLRLLVKDTKTYYAGEARDELVITYKDIKIQVGDKIYSWEGVEDAND